MQEDKPENTDIGSHNMAKGREVETDKKNDPVSTVRQNYRLRQEEIRLHELYPETNVCNEC